MLANGLPHPDILMPSLRTLRPRAGVIRSQSASRTLRKFSGCSQSDQRFDSGGRPTAREGTVRSVRQHLPCEDQNMPSGHHTTARRESSRGRRRWITRAPCADPKLRASAERRTRPRLVLLRGAVAPRKRLLVWPLAPRMGMGEREGGWKEERAQKIGGWRNGGCGLVDGRGSACYGSLRDETLRNETARRS